MNKDETTWSLAFIGFGKSKTAAKDLSTATHMSKHTPPPPLCLPIVGGEALTPSSDDAHADGMALEATEVLTDSEPEEILLPDEAESGTSDRSDRHAHNAGAAKDGTAAAARTPGTSTDGAPLPNLTALRKSSRETRRVSFSPSIDDAIDIRQTTRISFPHDSEDEEDDIPRRVSISGCPEVRPRKSSLDWLKHNVHHMAKNQSESHRRKHEHRVVHATSRRRSFSFSKVGIQVDVDLRKSRVSAFRSVSVSKSTAIAGCHAKVLERLINVDAAGHVKAPVVDATPAKRKRRWTVGLTRKKRADSHAPKDINHKQVKQLRKALTDKKLANGIIAELRAMDGAMSDQVLFSGGAEQAQQVPQDQSSATSPAREALQRLADNNADAMKRKVDIEITTTSTRPRRFPLKAICLECPESEAMKRCAGARQLQTDGVSNAQNSVVPGPNASSPTEVHQLLFPRIPQGPTVMGVAAVNLITSPKATLAGAGLDAVGVFSALGNASGAAIKASGTDADLRPPLDRMAIFTFWWGFEITLPKPSMGYLSTAHSVSGAFLNFLSTMVISGGVPELLPFVKYLSMAFDLEYKAIQSADRGNGVVLAATWVMPLALVPRSWDYSLDSGAPKGAPDGNAPVDPPLVMRKVSVAPDAAVAAAAAASVAPTLPPPSSPRNSMLPPRANKRDDTFPSDLTPAVVHSHLSNGGTPTSHSVPGTPRASIALESLPEVIEAGVEDEAAATGKE